MERYHIYKLGLAILFYAVYCRRPIFANGLEVDDVIQNVNNATGVVGDDDDNYVYYQGVQGTPGIDFPVYSAIPRTTFTCRDVESGYYADLETDCQVFHICNEGRKISFLCPNGTVFQQSDLICEWWFKVNCTNSPNLYEESAEQLREDSLRRKSSRRVKNIALPNHGAVLRTEERKSVSTSMQLSVHKNKKIDEPSSRNFVETNNRINEQTSRNFVETNNQQKRVQNIAPLSNTVNINVRSNQNVKDNRQQNYNSARNNINSSAQSTTNARGGVKYNSNGGNNFRQNNENYQSTPGILQYEPNIAYKSTNAGNVQNLNQNVNRQASYNNKQQGKAEIVPAKLEYEYNQKFTIRDQNNNFGNARTVNEEKPKQVVSSQQKTNTYDNNSRGNSESNDQRTTVYNANFQYQTNHDNYNNNAFTVPSSFFEGNTNEQTNRNGQQQINRNSQRPKSVSNKNIPLSNNAYAKSINYNTKDYISSVTPLPNKYDTSQKKNVDAKSSIKQQSSVPLTLNDIRLRKVAPNESGESQITEETASFYKNTLNSIQQASKQNANPYPNHRETYSEIKDPIAYNTKGDPNKYFSTTISSHSTQPINNGQPFVGSMLTDTSKTVAAPFESSTKPVETRSRLSQGVDNSRPSNTTPRSISTTKKSIIYCCSGSSKTKSRAGSQVVYNATRNGKATSNLAYVGEEYVNITVPRYSTGYVKVGSNKPNRITFSSNQSRSNKATTSRSISTVGYTARPETTSSAENTDAFITTTKKYIPVLSEKFNVNTSKVSINSTQKGSRGGDNQRITFKLSTGISNNNQANAQKTVFTGINNQRTYNSTALPTSYVDNTNRVATGKSIGLINKNVLYSTVTPPAIFNRVSNLQTRPLPFSGTFNVATPSVQLLSPKSNDAPYVSTTQQVDTSRSINSGFYVTKPAGFSIGSTNAFSGSTGHVNTYIPTVPTVVPKNNILRPKPFELPSTETYISNSVFPSSTTPRTINEQYPTTLSTGNQNSFSSVPERPIYRLSSASPFSFSNNAITSRSNVPSVAPTLPTPFTTPISSSNSVYENVDNMINALMKIATSKPSEEKTNETPRPGLIIPPSAGPQTLHTLAVYFANALDGIVANKTESNDTLLENLTTEQTGDTRAINSLLTSSTVNKYKDLFKEKNETVTVDSRNAPSDANNDLEGQNSKNPVQTTPRVRQLARVFTQALSAYLDDPATFKKVLEEVRPTEPPPLVDDPTAGEEDEVLSFSDSDVKNNRPPIYSTTQNILSASPTWGYLLAFNTSATKINNFEVKNSLNPEKENLQGADSQSFVPQFNSLGINVEKTTASPIIFTAKPFSINNEETRNTALPVDHWTTSPDVARLWQTTLSVNPLAINSKLDTTESPLTFTTAEYESTLDDTTLTTVGEIKYDLRSLPKIDLNATQVHGLLIDFMNATEAEDSQRLQRILRRLNTTENEFLSKMKEIESNPLTRRLILLLISECGMNATKEIETKIPSHNKRDSQNFGAKTESLQTASSNSDALAKSNSDIKKYVDASLEDDEQDTRALQLLNSLYTIASRWGK